MLSPRTALAHSFQIFRFLKWSNKRDCSLPAIRYFLKAFAASLVTLVLVIFFKLASTKVGYVESHSLCGRYLFKAPGIHFRKTHDVCGSNQKCVISFGLETASADSLNGIRANLNLLPTLYPGWKMRIYHGPDVENSAIKEMMDLGVEMRAAPKDIPAAFRGLLVASDPEVDYFLVRKVHSRLSIRDRCAVEEWLRTDFQLHSIRDHPNHKTAFVDGMWGGKKAAVPDLDKSIRAFVSNSPQADPSDFLHSVVWPKAAAHTLSHDSYSCEQYPNAISFPTRRADFEFVGQEYHPDNHEPRWGEVVCCLLGNTSPARCRRQSSWPYS